MSATAISALLRSLRPSFRSPADRIVYAVHAWMMSRGFKLVAVGTATPEGASSLPETDLQLKDEHDHTLLYADADSAGSKPAVTIRTVPLGSDKLLVNLLSHGADAPQPQVVDVDVSAFTKPDAGVMEGYKDLPKLLQLFDSKLGASSSAEAAPASGSTAPAVPPDAPRPTGSTVLEERQPIGAGGVRMPAIGAGRVGRSDLYPPGVDPLMDPVGPGRVPLFPGGGGMHVGPGDPMFAGGMRHPQGPRPGTLPPGGRWDPIAPPGMQGFHPDDFQRNPGPRFHPDVQPPGPGRGSDWDSMFG